MESDSTEYFWKWCIMASADINVIRIYKLRKEFDEREYFLGVSLMDNNSTVRE